MEMIYDCFMFNGEYDILELRLNLLGPYVDKFLICESKETFSGKEKPLYFILSDRFDKWHSKIIYAEAPATVTDDPFVRAGHQKDYIRFALSLENPNPEDLIYYGDVDEIWTKQESEGKLRQLCYSYYLNNRSSEDWQGTNVFRYKNIKDLNMLRADHSVIIENGGWHFTNMGGYDEVMRKLESYDHQEVNIPWVRDGLKERMDNNIEFLGRGKDWTGNDFKLWIDESQLPKYILDNKETWITKGLWKS